MIVAGKRAGAPEFDTPALGWIGFATVQPPTEDYVPLFPWMGVVMVGIAVGHALAAQRLPRRWQRPAARRGLRRSSDGTASPSYMLHQPLLMATAWTIAWAVAR